MYYRSTVIKVLRECKIDKSKYWATDDTALTLHGVKTQTDSIEIACPRVYIDDIDRTYITEQISLVGVDEEPHITIMDGFQVQTLESILSYKLERSNIHDLPTLKLIMARLELMRSDIMVNKQMFQGDEYIKWSTAQNTGSSIYSNINLKVYTNKGNVLNINATKTMLRIIIAGDCIEFERPEGEFPSFFGLYGELIAYGFKIRYY